MGRREREEGEGGKKNGTLRKHGISIPRCCKAWLLFVLRSEEDFKNTLRKGLHTALCIFRKMIPCGT